MSALASKTTHAGHALGIEWVMLQDKLGFVPSFEGLRGLAILFVLFHHTTVYHPIHWAIGRGGVAIFFTLSGFLITGVLKGLYADSPTMLFALRRFYLDRCVRLTPPIVMGSMYGFYHSYAQGEDPKRLAVWAVRIFTNTGNITYDFLQRLLPFGPSKTEVWFDHLWSLMVEEQFYLFWSFALALYVRFKLRVWVLWAVFFYFQYAAWRIAYLRSPFYDWHSKYSLGASLYKMMLGCLLRLTPLPKHMCTWYIGGFVAYAVFAAAYVLLMVTTPYDTPSYESEHFVTGLCSYGTALWLPSLVTSGNWLLETRILRFIGRVSYSLYVYHFIQQTFDRSRFAYLRAWETVSLAFIVATISTIFIEEPLCRAYRKWSRRNDGLRQPAIDTTESNHCYVSIPLDETRVSRHSTEATPSSPGSVSTQVDERNEKH